MSVRRVAPLVLAFSVVACDALPGPASAPAPASDPHHAEPHHAEPPTSACAPRDADLPSAEALHAAGVDVGFTPRPTDPGEVDGDGVFVDAPDTLAAALPSVAPRPLLVNAATVGDADGDCMPDRNEAAAGTSPTNPDSDGDGWFDGPCNERRKLVLVSIKAHDEQEDIGDDELYIVTNDRRFPTNEDNDGYWNFDDGQSRTLSTTIATRVRGTNTTGALATARVEAWEDDVEVTNTWWVDDFLWDTTVNLGAYVNGQTWKVRKTGSSFDYEAELKLVIEKFADPTPMGDGDTDGDGIKESNEFKVSKDLGGIADPTRKDVLVELDWMAGHPLETRARRLVTSRLAYRGLTLQVRLSNQLTLDTCLTRTEARRLFDNSFQAKTYKAFRYAVITEVLWNDASGVAIGETFFVDDSTWWIDGGVLAQAGTFIHELGHTLGLTNDVYNRIDTIATPLYDSAMNYFYQPTMVDYSDSGAGGDTSDHNDWAVVSAAAGLRYTFGNSMTADNGVCSN